MSQDMRQIGEGLRNHLLAEMKNRGLTVADVAAASGGLISPIEARGVVEGWKHWNLRYVCAVATSLGIEADELLRAAREGDNASSLGGEVPQVVGGEVAEGDLLTVAMYFDIRQQIVDLWKAIADLAESEATTGNNLKVMAGSLRDLLATVAGEAVE